MKWVFDFIFGKKNKKTQATVNTKTNEVAKKQKKKPKKISNNNTKPKEEIWRPVKDFEGHYEISSLGNVRSVDRTVRRSDGVYRLFKSRPVAPFYDKRTNERCVTLSKNANAKNIRIKTIVAYAFLGNPPYQSYEIDYLDGTKNPVATNLKYVKRKYSGSTTAKPLTNSNKISVKSTDNSTKQQNIKKRPYRAKISATEEKLIMELYKVGYTTNQIIKESGRSIATVRRIIRRNTKSAPINKTPNSPPIQLRIL